MKTKMTIKNQKGAAAVEFAIVAPLLVLLVIGICEFGLLWYNSQVIINASREGARSGIVQRTDSDGNPLYNAAQIEADITSIVQNYSSQRLITFGSNSPPSVSVSGENGAFQQPLQVDVTYNYTFLLPSLFGFSTTKTLTATTVMKMEAIIS